MIGSVLGMVLLVSVAAPVLGAYMALDPSFGNLGRVVYYPPLGSTPALALQGDGKLVAADEFTGIPVRFDADGSPDGTFGTGGVGTPPPLGHGRTRDLLVQGDGRIVLVGENNAVPPKIRIVRFDADGSPDGTFGAGGLVTIDLGSTVQGIAAAVALQSDGDIVIAGRAIDGLLNEDLLLIRLKGDGTLDATFGSGGIVIRELGGSQSFQDVVVQPDGKILAVGGTDDINAGEFSYVGRVLLVRHLTDGSLDPSFGAGGTVVTAPGGGLGSGATAVVLQPDDKIVTIARVDSSTAVLRFQTDGTPDPTFGQSGVTEVLPYELLTPRDLVLESDGSIVVVGGQLFFDAFRVSSAGIFDPTFAPCAILVTEFPENRGPARAIVRQSDGRLVIAGKGLARYRTVPSAACAAAQKAQLKVKAQSNLTWRWQTSAPLPKADFGDPLTTSGVALCLIDPIPTPSLAHHVEILPDGLCDGRPCWRELPTGFRYKRFHDFAGRHRRTTLSLMGSNAGGRLDVKTHDFPAGPFDAPLTTRLYRTDVPSLCWEVTFTSNRRPGGDRFVGKVP